MPDVLSPPAAAAATPPAVTPGHQTSEWNLTLIAQVVGAALEGLATAIQTMQAGGVNATWFAIALALIGVVLQVATAFGYVKGRAQVKSAQLIADASKAGAGAPPGP